MHGVVVAALLALVACVDAPTEATQELTSPNQLAVDFDVLSQEQEAAGDVERGEELRWAALAIRLGVKPTVFTMYNAGVREEYNAFVHSARWVTTTDALRPASNRSLVAWRHTDQKVQVILVSLRSDSATVLHPYSLRLSPPGVETDSPILAARAAYFERSSPGSAWLGVDGWARIELESLGSSCVTPMASTERPSGVGCQTARYEVDFDIDFAGTTDYSSRLMAASPPFRRIIADEGDVAGVLLTFSCMSPRSDRGC
jgi:hypothetical protein